MPDPKTSLSDILAELHEALESSDDLGEVERERLRSTAREIQQAIGDDTSTSQAQAQADPSAPQSLSDRLNEALESFEGKHPKLTAIVGRIADALSDMGI